MIITGQISPSLHSFWGYFPEPYVLKIVRRCTLISKIGYNRILG